MRHRAQENGDRLHIYSEKTTRRMTMLNDTTVFSEEELRPLTDTACTVIGVYLTLTAIGALFGNIVCLATCKKSQKFSRKLHAHLITHLAIAGIALTASGHVMFTVSAFAGTWVFGDYGCVLAAFLCYFFALVCSNIHVAISVYRYIEVCKPHLRYFLDPRQSPGIRCFALAASWLYALFWTSLPLFGWSKYTYESFGVSCSLNWESRDLIDVTYIYSSFFFSFAIHIIVIVFCYIKRNVAFPSKC
ncbi:rhodopsin, G0-coupled-like [Lingula anatina]|uniref:Rhodopsin, G0-coupled-like n=1 Tax=Lingula anatina TaxID=7574 RepID=A0A1S3JRS1_LINAN|nr:rhodopsin, G0-coupled-like [Lingula anatina]|eukprot:XP_013413103.1 rhodopsin, G0-coupled-like [Lingula anatina]